jgi:hypothetical protein
MRRILRISLAILIALAMSTHNFVSASKLQLESSKGKLLPQIVEKIEESDSSGEGINEAIFVVEVSQCREV